MTWTFVLMRITNLALMKIKLNKTSVAGGHFNFLWVMSSDFAFKCQVCHAAKICAIFCECYKNEILRRLTLLSSLRIWPTFCESAFWRPCVFEAQEPVSSSSSKHKTAIVSRYIKNVTNFLFLSESPGYSPVNQALERKVEHIGVSLMINDKTNVCSLYAYYREEQWKVEEHSSWNWKRRKEILCSL